MENYEQIKQIDQTTLSDIYLCKNKHNNEHYVMKIVDKKKLRGAEFNEIKLFEKLNCTNIVKCIDAFEDDEKHVIILEQADKSLTQEMIDRIDFELTVDNSKTFDLQVHTFMTREEMLHLICQILLGLYYLHEKRHIIHRDVKPGNILLINDKEHNFVMYKLCDLGISKQLQSIEDNTKTMTGTPMFMAPEQYLSQQYSYKTDIFSLGITIYDTMTCSMPYEFQHMRIFKNKQNITQPFNIRHGYDSDIDEIVKLMLMQKPIDRPTALQLLHHNAFSNELFITRDFYLKMGYMQDVKLIDEIIYKKFPMKKLINKMLLVDNIEGFTFTQQSRDQLEEYLNTKMTE